MSKHAAAWLTATAFVVVLSASIVGVGGSALAEAQAPPAQLPLDAMAGTAFTYQGRLTDGGVAADGVFDFRVKLYEDAAGGTSVGEVIVDDVTVTGGLFSAALDFGPGAFTGDARYLSLAVRPGSDSGSYTELAPRQPLTPAPYALALPGMRTLQDPVSPSVVGGHSENTVVAPAVGATIAGGGKSGDGNTVAADFGSIGGGFANQVWGGPDRLYATIGGGARNNADGNSTTVAGGWDNSASGYASTVAGGANNRAVAGLSSIAGGTSNVATGDLAAIGGGQFITVEGKFGAVGGGMGNLVRGEHGVVGGGDHNTAEGDSSVVGGGTFNLASGVGSTVAGGTGNTPSGPDSTVGGGAGNTADGRSAVVSGGGGTYFDGDMAIWSPNAADGDFATVGGGGANTARGEFATVSGGVSNTVNGDLSTVGGGGTNTTGAPFATIGGGINNSAAGDGSTVGGGGSNQASGLSATVPGGLKNTASAAYSFAAGLNANANHEGAFVWADALGRDFPFQSTRPNEFSVRATGGVIMASGYIPQSAMWTGVELPPGAGSWQSLSDRRAKQDVAAVDPQAVLAQLAAVPISTWSYRTEAKGVRHIGPMADDFSAAFDVGSDTRHISTVDADGVALAAIQGLYKVVQDKDQQVRALEAQLTETEAQLTQTDARLTETDARLADLETRLARLEAQRLNVAATGQAPPVPADGRAGSPAGSRVPLALGGLLIGAAVFGGRGLLEELQTGRRSDKVG